MKKEKKQTIAKPKTEASTARSLRVLVRTVRSYYGEHGRGNLPWRKTRDPYAILVSEIMLQQTQVDRVVPFFNAFLAKFPTPQALARAPLSEVLISWQGLGYNRRARMLREAAKVITEKYEGRLPRSREELEALPGIGPYTAGAVRVFAFNEPDVLIETNVRAVFIHHLFPNTSKVNDRHILMCAEMAAKGQDPRTWHSALMDYGTHLKKLHVNPARRSAHHVKQPRFEGSLRQARGAILRGLASGIRSEKKLSAGIEEVRFQSALQGLKKEKLIIKKGSSWSLATD